MDERQVHVVEIKAPISAVWAEITKLKHAQKPMFNTVLESDFKPGSRMIYRSQDGKRVFIIGEVREFVPPRRFVHTFRFTNLPETPTLVEWNLEEKAGVTRVTDPLGGSWFVEHLTDQMESGALDYIADVDAMGAWANAQVPAAQTAKADLIVSGDRKHLLILKRFEGIPIVTAAQAVAMVEAL